MKIYFLVLPWIVAIDTLTCIPNSVSKNPCMLNTTEGIYMVQNGSVTFAVTTSSNAALDDAYGLNQSYCQRNGIAPCK